MKITEIGSGHLSHLELKAYANKESAENKQVEDTKSKKVDENNFQWQKNILMDAIEKLENNIHMDNSHPLDGVNNAPIEKFSEAVIEASFIREDILAKEGADAQANIEANTLLSFLTAEDYKMIS